MGFMSGEERALGAALSRLGYANPFLPERIEAERAALGPAFVHADRVWSVRADRTVQNPNIARLGERAAALAATLRERLAAGAEPAASDRGLYEDVVLYLPFDSRTQRFAARFGDLFHPLNLSALSPTLIESELFGHRRGAFTGALQDRAGWLETCEPFGTVFLDEIGDADPAIQVKLLRVLQARTFQRLGDTKPLLFRGKIMAATNRDLAREIQAGRFREDFYYRLCSDIIATPPLADQLRESPDELPNLILFLARRLLGDEEAEALADEVQAWIEEHLGPSYPWPGNVRELEQCVRNVLIRGEYRPPTARDGHPEEQLAAALRAGALTADQLLARYCALVYAETRSYQETARRLGLDRRPVKSKVDQYKTEGK